MAAPSGKLPSAVRSGKSNILYVIYMPSAIMAYIIPCSKTLNNKVTTISPCCLIMIYLQIRYPLCSIPLQIVAYLYFSFVFLKHLFNYDFFKHLCCPVHKPLLQCHIQFFSSCSIDIQTCLCNGFKTQFFCCCFTGQNLCRHSSGQLSKFKLVKSHSRQTSGFYLVNLTSEYRNAFFICSLDNRLKCGYYRIVSQVVDAVYF